MSRLTYGARNIRTLTDKLDHSQKSIQQTLRRATIIPLSQTCIDRRRHLVQSRCFTQQASMSTSPSTSTVTTLSIANSDNTTGQPASSVVKEKKSKVPLRRRIRSFLSADRQFVINASIILSAASASYIVFDQCVEFVSFMQSINHAEGLTYAFYGGMFVTISTYTIFRCARVLMPVKTTHAYRTLLKRLRQEPSVLQQLGTPRTYRRIQEHQGGFKCVTRRNGGPRWLKESSSVDYFASWERWWRPRRVQFVMSFRGEKADAVLVAQVDHKLNDVVIVKSMSLEHIQAHVQDDSSPVNRLLIVDPKGAPWRESVASLD